MEQSGNLFRLHWASNDDGNYDKIHKMGRKRYPLENWLLSQTASFPVAPFTINQNNQNNQSEQIEISDHVGLRSSRCRSKNLTLIHC